MKSDFSTLPNALALSHQFIRAHVRPGAVVVDATAGNGHDTLMLAQLVGPSGRVHAFDTQAGALAATAARLAGIGSAAPVLLHLCGHEEAAEVLAAHGEVSIRAAMFNLGYLPGGDKSIITRPATTCAGLRRLLPRLEPGGLITIVLYTGHPGGGDEALAVAELAAGLPRKEFFSWQFLSLNQSPQRPGLIVIHRGSHDAA